MLHCEASCCPARWTFALCQEHFQVCLSAIRTAKGAGAALPSVIQDAIFSCIISTLTLYNWLGTCQLSGWVLLPHAGRQQSLF